MDEWQSAITDPASVLVGLGALCGLLAARFWWRVASSVASSGEVVKRPDLRSLSSAALLTSATLGLACLGYLLGRFNGAF